MSRSDIASAEGGTAASAYSNVRPKPIDIKHSTMPSHPTIDTSGTKTRAR